MAQDRRDRRVASPEEFAAIQQYLQGHDFSKKTFTLGGQEYKLVGGEGKPPQYDEQGNPIREALDQRSYGVQDANGRVIQMDANGQVSDVAAITNRQGNGPETLGLLSNINQQGGDPKLWQFAAIAGAGAAAGAATGAGGAAGTAGTAGGATSTGLGGVAGMGGGSGLTLGGGTAAAGMGGGTGLTAGGVAGGGAALGAGTSAAGALGGLGGAASTGAGMLGSVANWASQNPGLIGAGLGAIAGAASGNVDVTSQNDMTRSENMNRADNMTSNTSATRGLADYALPAGQDYARMAQNTIGGAYLGQGLGTNPYAGQNQYLNSAMDNVARRMTDSYRDGTASQTMGQFAQGGAFGGSAMQQYQESQNRAFGDSLGAAMTGMQMQDYTQQQGLAENQLNRQLSQFQGERNNMMGAAGGLANLGGTNTQMTNQQGTSQQQSNGTQNNTSTMQGVGPVQGALAGALGGWAMGNQWGAAPSQQPAVGGLGGQPLTLGMQQPQGAVSYNQPGLGNTMLYAGGNPNFYR
jgi:hypothetical protein